MEVHTGDPPPLHCTCFIYQCALVPFLLVLYAIRKHGNLRHKRQEAGVTYQARGLLS